MVLWLDVGETTTLLSKLFDESDPICGSLTTSCCCDCPDLAISERLDEWTAV